MYLTDRAESLGKTISKFGKGKTGMSTFHWLTLASTEEDSSKIPAMVVNNDSTA